MPNIKISLLSILFISLFISTLCSCNKDEKEDFAIVYRVTFDGTWSESTHPNAYPSKAAFSAFVGLTHSNNVELYAVGDLAIIGVQRVAELGATSVLTTYIDELIEAGSATDKVVGETFDSPGSNENQIGISVETPLISIVSRVVPSPDWFVGVKDVNLYENGSWVTEKVVNVEVFDSGTDSSTGFNENHIDSSPINNISEVTDPPLAVNNVVATMGTFTFTKVK